MEVQLRNAFYSVYGRERSWGDINWIAHGLSFSEANDVVSGLRPELERRYAGSNWSAPYFGIHLMKPEVVWGPEASPGDITVVSVKTGEGQNWFSEALVLCEVVEVTSSLLVAKSLHGELTAIKRVKAQCFKACDLDMAAVLQRLRLADANVGQGGYRVHLNGYFSSIAMAATFLREHMVERPKTEVDNMMVLKTLNHLTVKARAIFRDYPASLAWGAPEAIQVERGMSECQAIT